MMYNNNNNNTDATKFRMILIIVNASGDINKMLLFDFLVIFSGGRMCRFNYGFAEEPTEKSTITNTKHTVLMRFC